MCSLTTQERLQFEKLFRMEGGYVLGFSDASFGNFFAEYDIPIHSGKYEKMGSSKAKKLREFWSIEADPLVGRVMLALIDEWVNQSPENQELLKQCRKIASHLISGNANLTPLKEVAVIFNAKHLAEQIQRMESSVNSDPSLAIGTAKELIETCCKTILSERGKSVAGTPDVSTLTKETLKVLKLVPEGIDEAVRGADVIKRLLSNLGTIGNGLAELRGLYGTGHGKHAGSAGLSSRHAKLAVGAASTLSVFLFETHMEAKLGSNLTLSPIQS
jgi:hypothetical protein